VAIVQLDRGDAIIEARWQACHGVVVVAGKGHETTQNIGGTSAPWDDRAFVRMLAAAYSASTSSSRPAIPPVEQP
jgi:UDP-N-acetylmuramoyl-L-alanyl-D-glutamate--2,6-diaminopimelate ligase